MTYNDVVISSGHGLKVSGANGLISEVQEARRVVEKVAEYLRILDCEVDVFHDDTSTNQNKNLQTIVNFHNSKKRKLDISVHFNAANKTSSPRGTEVFYYAGSEEGKIIASNIVNAISNASGLKNRGVKNNKLYFTTETNETSTLIEIAFVDSEADVELYNKYFDNICRAIAESITGKSLAIVSSATTEQNKEEINMTKDEVMQLIEEAVNTKLNMQPSNKALRDAVSTVLMRFQNKEIPLSAEWRDKANSEQLSISDAIALLYLAIQREYIQK